MDLRSFIDNFFFFSPREPRDFGSSGCCFARWRNLCSSESSYSRNVFLERSCNVRVVRKTVLRFTLKFFSNLILVFRTFHIGLRRLRVWHEINWFLMSRASSFVSPLIEFCFFSPLDDKRLENPCWTFPRCSLQAMSIENPFAWNFAIQEIEKKQQNEHKFVSER